MRPSKACRQYALQSEAMIASHRPCRLSWMSGLVTLQSSILGWERQSPSVGCDKGHYVSWQINWAFHAHTENVIGSRKRWVGALPPAISTYTIEMQSSPGPAFPEVVEGDCR